MVVNQGRHHQYRQHQKTYLVCQKQHYELGPAKATLHYILGPPESTPRDVHGPPEVTLEDILGQKGCSTCEWHNFVLKLGRHIGGRNNKNLKMLPVEWPPKDWSLKRSQEIISTACSVHSGLINAWIMTICHSILPPSDVQCSCNFMMTWMTVDIVVYSSPLISAVYWAKSLNLWSDIHSEMAKLSFHCNPSSSYDKLFKRELVKWYQTQPTSWSGQ